MLHTQTVQAFIPMCRFFFTVQQFQFAQFDKLVYHISYGLTSPDAPVLMEGNEPFHCTLWGKLENDFLMWKNVGGFFFFFQCLHLLQLHSKYILQRRGPFLITWLNANDKHQMNSNPLTNWANVSGNSFRTQLGLLNATYNFQSVWLKNKCDICNIICE